MDDWRHKIDQSIDSIADELRDVRRYLHAHPEPSRQEFQTTAFLARLLDKAAIPHRLVASGRGIVAGVDAPPGASHVALRADMDALHIRDEKEVPYRSTRDGVMHACGHDAHSTMVLGAALALSRCASDLPWPVAWRAIFQPAEEVAEGAHEMVQAGAVDDVRAIVALHVAPELKVGTVALRRGVMTAFCQDIDVTIRGSGGHAARPFLAIDPIAAAALFITTAYQAIPRAVDVRDPVVVTFGSISGGNSSNVIPDRVTLRGTLRTLGRTSAASVRDRLNRVAQGVAIATGAEIVLNFNSETDAVYNDPDVSAACQRAAFGVVGADNVQDIPLPSMGGEDFSGYLGRTPGCLMRLGVAPSDDPAPALHTSCFDIDERALAVGAKVLAHSAVFLARPGERNK